MDPELVVSALERKGWRISPLAEGWGCDHAHVSPMTLSVTPSWVSFCKPVSGLQALGLEGLPQGDRDFALLKLNETLFLGRYALDPALNPVLLVDLPRSSGLPMLDTAMEALSRYGESWPAESTPARSGASDTGNHDLLAQETPGLAQETVSYYVRAIEGHGWGLRSKPSGMTWPLGYKGQRLFDVFFSASPAWAYFQVPMLPGIPAAITSQDERVRASFARYLLRVNEVWYMAKLSLTAAGQPIMMLEVPTQELDYDLFRLCTRLIASYLDFYARELQIMAELERDHTLRAWMLAG